MMSYGSLGKRDGVECDDERIPERRLEKSEEKKERGKMCYGFMYTMMSYGSLGKRDGVECDDERIPERRLEKSEEKKER
ncbi:hypothetical protein NDU88_003697 [Pleurodeles waltl]|uniref:Uncharacterized protein n=1 Tax=Pleurodeles waltl TaxID=8319 RepID=A0AAV7VE45_PLEWA|nr:hypothetical protein NDU88_003697 [Pleurodeles waltl]